MTNSFYLVGTVQTMNTKHLMSASAIVMGAAGAFASFLPQEILNALGTPIAEWTTLNIQIIGALYLGFAMMNWMAKTVLIGGIYSRPLAVGNFMHFVIAGLALVKVAIGKSSLPYIWIASVVYLIFAVAFGVVLLSSPTKK